MSEGIAAERSRPVARMREHLLALGAKRFYVRKGGMQVVHMKIEMHRRPVAVEFAPIDGTRRGFGAWRLLQKAQFDIETVQDGHTRNRLGLLGQAKCGAVKGNTFGKTRHVNARF